MPIPALSAEEMKRFASLSAEKESEEFSHEIVVFVDEIDEFESV